MLSLAGGPDVVQTLAADATGKMSVELSRGVSGAANQSLTWLGGLAGESGGARGAHCGHTSILGSRFAKAAWTGRAGTDMGESGRAVGRQAGSERASSSTSSSSSGSRRETGRRILSRTPGGTGRAALQRFSRSRGWNQRTSGVAMAVGGRVGSQNRQLGAHWPRRRAGRKEEARCRRLQQARLVGQGQACAHQSDDAASQSRRGRKGPLPFPRTLAPTGSPIARCTPDTYIHTRTLYHHVRATQTPPTASPICSAPQRCCRSPAILPCGAPLPTANRDERPLIFSAGWRSRLSQA